MRLHFTIITGALATGCTFPEVTFDSGGGGSGGAASTSSSPSASTSASTSGSGGSTSSMMGCKGNWGEECDDDGDMVAKLGVDCCPDPLQADCDDNNPAVFPGQTEFFPTPISGTDFDYDCDGTNEREFEYGFCTMAFSNNCDDDPQPQAYKDGPMDEAACGQAVTHVFCTSTTTCGETPTASYTLKCR